MTVAAGRRPGQRSLNDEILGCREACRPLGRSSGLRVQGGGWPE